MLMIAEISQAEIFKPVNELLIRIAVIVVITILIILLLSLVIVLLSLKPIVQLTVWAEEISRGSFSKHEFNVPDNEIGVLYQTFTEVTESLNRVVNVCQHLL